MAIEQTSRISAVLTGHHRDGGWICGVVAKQTYIVVAGRCEAHPQQQPLVEEPLLSDDGVEMLHDSDFVLQRECADLIIEGHAYPPERRKAFEASIKVDHFMRRILVFGDRRIERRADGTLRFTSPSAFEKMPLSWRRAYGGVDRVMFESLGDPLVELMTQEGKAADPRFGLFGYPRNPVGRGYLIENNSAAVEACELPNFEEPNQILTPQNVVREDFMLWGRGPVVASFGWLHYAYFPRSVQFGAPPPPYHTGVLKPHDFVEVRLGCLKPASLGFERSTRERLDTRVVQASAVGMRSTEILPNATLELENLHPRNPKWSFRLPGGVPRIAFKLSRAPAAYLTPKIRTLRIEPDADRVTVVWTAETRLDLPLPPAALQEIQHGVLWP